MEAGELLCDDGLSLLDVHNLTFEVDAHLILDRLNLTIESQEIHALLGANGSGKTTPAYLLMGCKDNVPSGGGRSCRLHGDRAGPGHASAIPIVRVFYPEV